MSLLRIVWRNIAQRGLSSALTALSIALGVALVVTILSLQQQGRDRFSQGAFGYELIVGAKGSATQLVLNTVYHLDRSPGNIPTEVYERLKAHPGVKLAAPMAVGDTFRGYRIVGTSDVFLRDFEVTPGKRFEVKGKIFGTGGREAVVGAVAARETGLAIGSTFEPAHGLEGAVEHEETWTVVGLLEPTGTPADRAIYINIDSFFSIAGHQTGRAEISAVVVKTKTQGVAIQLPGEFPDVMVVSPAAVVAELMDQLAPIGPVMLVIAGFVIVVAGISIMVSIYNSMAERRREIAVMRALGARRGTILRIILCEAAALCVAGGLAGIVLGHGLVAGAAPMLQSSAGLTISPWVVLGAEPVLLGGLVILGILVGVVPALRGFRVEIADGLV